MHSYLESIAQVFASEVGIELSQYTFVFPNHRAGLFFRKHLCKALQQPIFAPKIITINECFASLTHLQVADQLTLLLRLYRAYKKRRENAEELEHFLHWGKMMLADFSEVDNHCVKDVKSLYALVEDMHDIDVHFASLQPEQINAIKRFWQEFHTSYENNNGNHMHQQFIRTWQLLYPLYCDLREDLLKEGLAYEGLLHRQVLESWDSITEDKFSKQYVFIGFNAMTKSERQLMLNLQQMGRADFYFDYSDHLLRDEQNAASRFMQDNQLLFRSRYTLPDVITTPLEEKDITLITVSSSVSQAHQVHEVLDRLKDNVSDWTRTAVVLPNEELLIPLLHTIPSDIQKINVTMGYPLRATQPYKLMAYPEKEMDIPQDTNVFFEQMYQALHEMLNTNNTESIYQMLKVVERVQQASLEYTDIDFSVQAVQQLLKMLSMEMTIPYTGEPLEGLQIMGVLETRALEFDNIIITDFNDDTYPGRSRNNSFIPYTLRRGFDLPTIERQDAIFSYNFYRMLSHAKNIWFIANTHADDQHSGELSRYYYQLIWQYQLPIKHVIINDKLLSNIPERLPISKTSKAMEALEDFVRGGKRNLSATALGDYLRCPKYFYYKYLERIREKDWDETITISDATLGEVYHEIMQDLYTPLEGKQVLTADLEERKRLVYDDDDWRKRKPLEKLQGDELAEKIIRNSVYDTLEHDLKLTPFEYIKSELAARRTIHLPNFDKEISLFGKIDRLDVKQNQMRVIDYKTGSAHLEYSTMAEVFGRSKKVEEEETSIRNEGNRYILQTLLYCWMAEANQEIKQMQEKYADTLIKAPNIYSVRQLHNDSKPTYVHHKEDEILYTEDIAQDFVEQLSGLLEEIYNPDLPFYPTQDMRKCEGCYLSEICLLPQKKEDA